MVIALLTDTRHNIYVHIKNIFSPARCNKYNNYPFCLLKCITKNKQTTKVKQKQNFETNSIGKML